MSLLSTFAILALLALLGAAAWVRLAPTDPALWHVDPADATARGPQNSYLLADAPGADAPALRLAQPPDVVAGRLSRIILGTPRTLRVSGDDGFATYVTRSALWGFPDYTSVRVTADGQGAAVSLFARSRFGRGDMGVNRGRVKGWLASLAAAGP